MAFTTTERARMMFYLGYSVFEDDGAAQRAINSLDSKETSAGPIVRELLDNIQQIDKDIFDTRVLSMAIEDGSVKVRSHYTLAHLRTLGRQYVLRLSQWTKIKIARDVFSGASTQDGFYSGDPSERRYNNDDGVPRVGDT